MTAQGITTKHHDIHTFIYNQITEIQGLMFLLFLFSATMTPMHQQVS